MPVMDRATPFGLLEDGSDATKLLQGEWRTLVGGALGDGVLGDTTGAAWQVTAPGTGTIVNVAPGALVLQGWLGQNDTADTLDVSSFGTAPTSVQRRIDLVIARVTPGTKTLELTLKPGTPAAPASAVRPALTRTSATWEMALAVITRDGNVAVTNSMIRMVKTWTGPRVLLTDGETLPTDAPCGTTAAWENRLYVRTKEAGAVVWELADGGPYYTAATTSVAESGNTTPRLLQLDTINRAGFTEPTAGNRIVVPQTGRYRLTVTQSVIGVAGRCTVQARVNSAGSPSAGTQVLALDTNPGGVRADISGTRTVSLVAGNYLQFFWTPAGAGQSLDGSPPRSVFELEYVGRN